MTMGTYLNPYNCSYAEIVNSETFVDKTLLIQDLSKRINTASKYICISRPRRFGKSVNAEMLSAFYSKEINSAELFDHLNIAHWQDYKKHLNQHHVIFLNIQSILNDSGNKINNMVDYINVAVTDEIKQKFKEINYTHCDNLSRSLQAVFSQSALKHKIQFIFIIDEWDTVFRYKNLSQQDRETYIEFLNGLLKDKPYVSLAFMTGILPVKKYGTDSLLNMFNECSVFSSTFSEYFGFTEDEVKNLCTHFNRDYYLFELWYDGYRYHKEHRIFNPNSVTKALIENRMDSYWSLSEKYEILKQYIDLNLEGLRDLITQLLAGEQIPVNVDLFDNQFFDLHTKDQVLTALIHLGYLATISKTDIFGGNDYYAYIPNREIKLQFTNNIMNTASYSNVIAAIEKSNHLLEAIWNKDANFVATCIDQSHSENTSIIKYNNENSLSAILSIALYAAQNYYHCIREYPSGKGFADLVYIPRRTINKPALVVELKYNKSERCAISQIKNKEYPASIAKFCGEVLLVAINYDQKSKKHSCIIESFAK